MSRRSDSTAPGWISLARSSLTKGCISEPRLARTRVESVNADGALDHRAELDRRYIGPDHVTDPAFDRDERVVITLRPVRVVTA